MSSIPKRMCIVCKNRYEKIYLNKFIRTRKNILIRDKIGKMNGRGMYICYKKECMDKNINNKLLEKYSKKFSKNKEIVKIGEKKRCF